MENSQYLKKVHDKIFSEIFEKYDLKKNEVQIIIYLKDNPNGTARDIVKEFMFAKSQVSYSIDSLYKKGYIKKENDKEDKKIIHLALTDKVENIFEDIDLKYNKFFQIIFEGISDEEKKEIDKLFNKILKNIKKCFDT